MVPYPTEGPSAPDRPIELAGACLHDVERGDLFPAGTRLLLRGTRIDALLAPGTPSPPTARRIDLGGRHLVPGLLNAHAHLQLVLPSLLATPTDAVRIRHHAPAQRRLAMRQCLERGVTTVHDALTADLELNRRLLSADERGPRLRQSVHVGPLGGPFSAERGWRDRLLYAIAGLPFVGYEERRSGIVTFAPDAGVGQVRDAVDRAIDERGADAIKLYDQAEQMFSYEPGARMLSQGQLDAATDQARRRGVATNMHHLTVQSLRRGLRAGVGTLVHLPCDGPLAAEDVASFVRSGCVLVPTVSLAFALCFATLTVGQAPHARLAFLERLRAARLEATTASWLPELVPTFRRGFAKAGRGATRLFGLLDMGRVFRHFAGVAGAGVDNLVRLAEAGCPIACGNDAGAIPCTTAMVGLELELLAALGGPPLRAGSTLLRAATLHAARSLGLESSHGAIGAGRVADLVALKADPRAEPALLGAAAEAVLLDGKLVVDRCGLRAQLAAA